MTPTPSALSPEFLHSLCDEYKKYNHIDTALYNNNNVKRGLRNADGTGVVAGLTNIGNVHGYIIDEGDIVPVPGKLYYRGIDLEQLVNGFLAEDRFGFEETSYLLLFGHLPTEAQLKTFNDTLAEMRYLPEFFTEDQILRAPSPNIMNKMARATLGLYTYDENPDDTSIENMMRQGMELIARFPMILAHAYQAKRHFYDKASLHIHFPKGNQSTAESILRTIRSDKKYTMEEAKLLDLCLVLHAEHGGGNNSAFACRVLSSSGTDTYAAISAALGSLKGPLHGGANAKVIAMFEDIRANVRDWKDEDEVMNYLKKMINKEAGDHSGKIYGMGHAVYTLSDPRAVILKKNARSLAEANGRGDELNLMELVEKLAPIALAQTKGGKKKICANVDLYSGFVYETLGIPQELYTPLFAAARIAGWIAHRMEEVTTNARIMRPAYKSVCPVEGYVPMKERIE